jgi:hypothetical protein
VSARTITVVRYGYRLLRSDWAPRVDFAALEGFVESLHEAFVSYGISVTYSEELDNLLEVRGYADLLNTIRLRCPEESFGNLCLGHVIGQSDSCDLFEDIRRGVSRLAFAPEMIEPEGSNKVVCHNCGCGC